MDSLRYWVQAMHVDGFCFDLASILSRDEAGRSLESPPILWDIETDPFLAGTKLIAEASDAAGLYQVGSFIGDSWKEWNGQFRDDVRSFVKGDAGTVTRLAQRLLGSPDLYEHPNFYFRPFAQLTLRSVWTKSSGSIYHLTLPPSRSRISATSKQSIVPSLFDGTTTRHRQNAITYLTPDTVLARPSFLEAPPSW